MDELRGAGVGRTAYDVAHQVGHVQLRVHLHGCGWVGASIVSRQRGYKILRQLEGQNVQFAWDWNQRRVYTAQREDNVDFSDVVVVEVVIQTRLKSKARLEGCPSAANC